LADVEATKPEPDLALEKAGNDDPSVTVGDSVWDVEAARCAGLPTLVAVPAGGCGHPPIAQRGHDHVGTCSGLAGVVADGDLGIGEIGNLLPGPFQARTSNGSRRVPTIPLTIVPPAPRTAATSRSLDGWHTRLFPELSDGQNRAAFSEVFIEQCRMKAC
jgi:hypothetical protein